MNVPNDASPEQLDAVRAGLGLDPPVYDAAECTEVVYSTIDSIRSDINE